jgi:hypothetical protein
VNLRFCVAALLASALLSAPASAIINQAVEDACQSECLTYCFGMKIPSDPLRAWFRQHMLQLSLRCAKALLDDHEATKADMEKYIAATTTKRK